MPQIKEVPTIQWLKETEPNNDLQNTTEKTKDWATRTPLKTGVNSGASEGLAIPAPDSIGIRRVTLVTNPKIIILIVFPVIIFDIGLRVIDYLSEYNSSSPFHHGDIIIITSYIDNVRD